GERVATMAGVEVQPGAPLARARAGAGAATPGGGGAAKAAVVAAAGGKVAAGAAARGDGEGADDAGKGGPLLPDQGALTVEELAQAISEVALTLEQRTDQLNLIESEVLFQRAASRLAARARPRARAATA